MNTYRIIENICIYERKNIISYGIAVFSNKDTQNPILVIEDITTDRKALDEFVKKCNDLELSILHIHDVIEDFISESYWYL